MLSKSIWAQALTEDQLARVEAEVVSRKIPAGGYVCRKGDPVAHWI